MVFEITKEKLAGVVFIIIAMLAAWNGDMGGMCIFIIAGLFFLLTKIDLMS